MKVIRKADGQSRQGTTFTGEARLKAMLTAQQEGGMQLVIVHFEDGAVTKWHEHPGEQILYVLEGKGRVGTADAQWEVQPGDVIYNGPGEKHWHGAAAGSSMSHISVTTVGPTVWYDDAPF